MPASATDWPWPAPVDDGGAAHLVPGTPLPAIALQSSAAGTVDLSSVMGRTVVFVYPWTGRAGLANPPGWDDIPGAHGSTPQAEGFRDLHDAFAAKGVTLFGLSGQDGAHHSELAQRLKLPFPLLSDAELAFARALRLPSFETGGVTYLRRLTLICERGRIVRALYPVHPPDRSATETLAAL